MFHPGWNRIWRASVRRHWSDLVLPGNDRRVVAGNEGKEVSTGASPGYMPQSKSQEWGTPREFFQKLDMEFRFTVDVCASVHNFKHPAFFTKEQNGLLQPWVGVAFCNPPYGAAEISLWIEKAIFERGARQTTTVFLLPNTTDVGWFHKYFYSAEGRSFLAGIECRFVKGRINFDPPKGQQSIANVKGSIVVIVRPV